MNKELVAIFEHMERERGIKRDILIQAIESALQAAARKSIKGEPNITVQINARTGEIEMFCEKEIVEHVTSPSTQITLEEAQSHDPDCSVGQFLDVPLVLKDFGRIAAQTARQVIAQKVRGAEKDVIYEEYRHRIGEIVVGVVKGFVKGANVIVDLGKVEAIMPMRHYPKIEKYQIGNKVYALLLEVRELDNGGAEVILSRNHPDFVKQLFMQEVPELEDQTVVIEKIVRDGGYRTKLIVRSNNPKVDPVGACVGVRGSRVKNIIRDLNNEKIDIIPYSSDPIELLQNILAPIQIKKVAFHDDEKVVAIVIDDADFAAVIGKRGMNARLTGELLGYNLEVQRISEYNKSLEIHRRQLIESDDSTLDQPLALEGLNKLVIQNLQQSGLDTLRKLLIASVEKSPEELAETIGISIDIVHMILEQVSRSKE